MFETTIKTEHISQRPLRDTSPQMVVTKKTEPPNDFSATYHSDAFNVYELGTKVVRNDRREELLDFRYQIAQRPPLVHQEKA